MNSALKDMLAIYQPKTQLDYQNAVREVVQELALLGLWRGGFFAKAAFYGGTALRIFHGLRRFSGISIFRSSKRMPMSDLTGICRTSAPN